MNFPSKKDFSEKRQKLEALVKELDARFTSGNDVQVKDVRLTYEEWKTLRHEVSTSIQDIQLLEKLYA